MNGPLDQAQCDDFQRDGFLVCEGFLNSQQHARLCDWTNEIANWSNVGGGGDHYREMTEGGPVLARTESFLDCHDGIRKLLCESPVCDAVSQLFGEPAVVFKEKINYKHPGGGGFAAHQDLVAYAYGSRHITCLIPVDDNTIENGCLWFAPGGHADGVLPVNDHGCLREDVVAGLSWKAAPIKAGGIVLFSSLAPHKSEANQSERSRRSLYVTYNMASEGDLRTAYYDERARAMEGAKEAGRGQSRISTIGHFQGHGIE